jgi:hypothetical protein
MTSKNTVLSWTENPRVISSILILGTIKSACGGRTVVKEQTFKLSELQQVFPPKQLQRRMPKLMALAEKHKRDRTPAPSPPEGGITLREGERRYHVLSQTISGWTRPGSRGRPALLPILLQTRNCVYVDEKVLADLAEKYLASPGRGYRTAYKSQISDQAS